MTIRKHKESGMLKPSMLWIFPIVALLTSCANSAQTRTAVATDCGFHFTGGSGLLGLKDRVEAIGGTMRLTSAPGAGTSLSVELPLRDPAAPR